MATPPRVSRGIKRQQSPREHTPSMKRQKARGVKRQRTPRERTPTSVPTTPKSKRQK
jgi:hypothetical protein